MNDILYPLNDTTFPKSHGFTKGEDSKAIRWRLSVTIREVIYQVLIIFGLLVFYSFKLDESETISVHTLFLPSKLAFFANYLVAAMIINYVLLPIFYYRQRAILFTLLLSLLLMVVILVDELVLEQVFFPDTRGQYFPGLLYTLVEILPIIIIIVAFKLAWDSNRKQSEVARLTSLVRESELQFLKSQINPHFLFNNLNSLYACAIENSPKTPTMILEMSAMLRYMLYDCKEDAVVLAKEVEHLKNYVALSQMQIGNRGKIQLTATNTGANFSISPLILIVFVENAIKHSTGSQSTNIDIDIYLNVSDDGRLTFLCANNYSPHYSSIDSAKGIGLENVKKRLDLQYPGKYKLDIQDRESIFNISLEMQLKN